ncbi:DUF6923 family protein [Streptomyces sp. NPDC090077]|uniref:DUF6923 family protein n=1 Tax=Streptomyces sp. NPDC090077 TaxID=3365938 RepID=UPI0038023F6D
MSRGTNGAVRGKRQRRGVAVLGAIGVLTGLAVGAPAPPAGAVAAPGGAGGSAAVSEPGHPDGLPVACDGKIYLSMGDPDQLHTVEREPGKVAFAELGDVTPFLYNAIGVNPHDRFLYGTTFGEPDGGNRLVRFDGKGHATVLGGIQGLPKALYISGTFDDEGNYYVLADNTGVIYRIDVEKRRVTRAIEVPDLAPTELDVFDIAFRDGFLWGSTEAGAITRIDTDNEKADFFPGVLPGGSDFGGVFVYGNGDLGFFRNSGELIRVRVRNATGSNPHFTVLSRQTLPEQSLTNVDATSCFFDSSADLSVHKRGPEVVKAGGEIAYEITVKNDHKGVSSGWSLVDDLPEKVLDPATDTEGCEIEGGLLSCTGGALREGGRVKIKVTGTAGNVSKPTAVPNTATVFGDDEDPHGKNDTGSASTKIKPAHGDGHEGEKAHAQPGRR